MSTQLKITADPAICGTCGNSIHWLDGFGRVHCEVCRPLPRASSLVKARLIVVAGSGIDSGFQVGSNTWSLLEDEQRAVAAIWEGAIGSGVNVGVEAGRQAVALAALAAGREDSGSRDGPGNGSINRGAGVRARTNFPLAAQTANSSNSPLEWNEFLPEYFLPEHFSEGQPT